MNLCSVFLCILILEINADEKDVSVREERGRCPFIKNALRHGKVKLRSRGRIAKFICNAEYELVGKRFATCVRGQWNNPVPICVSKGCNTISNPSNGQINILHRGAVVTFNCDPGYILYGSGSIFCDGTNWNDSAPACHIAIKNPKGNCSFENDLCGWSHDRYHDFDWRRHHFSTPSGHVGTGPSYDHTLGKGKDGYYMYIEASSPRKENDTARLFSPVYPAMLNPGCFVFWYHMYGTTTGSLGVFLKKESQMFTELTPVWEKDGEQGNLWLKGSIAIPKTNERFQIIIEGIRGNGYVGDTAIDDVELLPISCEQVLFANITKETDSCQGRCYYGLEENFTCSCNEECISNTTCCADYEYFCTAKKTYLPEFDSSQSMDRKSTSALPDSSNYTINEISKEIDTPTTFRNSLFTQSSFVPTDTVLNYETTSKLNKNVQRQLSSKINMISTQTLQDIISTQSTTESQIPIMTIAELITSPKQKIASTSKTKTINPLFSTVKWSTNPTIADNRTRKILSGEPTTNEKIATTTFPPTTEKLTSLHDIRDLIITSKTNKIHSTRNTAIFLTKSNNQSNPTTVFSPVDSSSTYIEQTTQQSPEYFTNDTSRSTVTTDLHSVTEMHSSTGIIFTALSTKPILEVNTKSYKLIYETTVAHSTMETEIPIMTTIDYDKSVTKVATETYTNASVITQHTTPREIEEQNTTLETSTKREITTALPLVTKESVEEETVSQTETSSAGNEKKTTDLFTKIETSKTITTNVMFPDVSTQSTRKFPVSTHNPISASTAPILTLRVTPAFYNTEIYSRNIKTSLSSTTVDKTLQRSTNSEVESSISTATEIQLIEDFSHRTKKNRQKQKDRSIQFPTDIIIGITIVILILSILVITTIYFYLRRRRLYQNKLAEDSEMKFLSDNEIIEFSDPTISNYSQPPV